MKKKELAGTKSKATIDNEGQLKRVVLFSFKTIAAISLYSSNGVSDIDSADRLFKELIDYKDSSLYLDRMSN